MSANSPEVARSLDSAPPAQADPASVLFPMLAEHTGVSIDRIQSSSRLLHDLGMDGDDALEFFEEIHRRFGTDLSALGRQWDRHFGPEVGGRPSAAAFIGFVLSIALILAFRLPTWSWLGAAAVFFAVQWLDLLHAKPKLIPITVAEVIDAIRKGVWS